MGLGRKLAVATFGFVVAAAAAAQDWPQWRGPNRDGVANGFAAPNPWPAELKLKWKATVGLGHSSPVVAGKQVFQFARQGENEVVAAFDLETGKSLWRDSYPAPYTMNPTARRHGPGPKSTPAVGGGRLYTLGISGILSAYDAANGKLRWRKEFGSQFQATSPLYGTAVSPVLDGKLVIAHVGGHDRGALVAFDADTGAVRWNWSGDGPGYASPIVVELGGVRQVVTQSQQQLIGVSVADGKLLWQMPFTTEYVQNAVTPVAFQNLLIFSGYDQPVFALRVSKQGATWTTKEVWRNNELPMYLNSPVLIGGLLFGMTHRNKGQLFALDAASGKTVWRGEPRLGDNAALAVVGDYLLVQTDGGELLVGRAVEPGSELRRGSAAGGEQVVGGPTSPGFHLLRRYSVASSPTWAHFALAGNAILVKDAETLALWSWN